MSGRGRNWEDDETKALLVIWSDSKIKRKLVGMRNAAAYRDISARLAALGFSRSSDQVRRKVKLMRREFKKASEHNAGNEHRGKCKYYRQLSNILSNKAHTNVQRGSESPTAAYFTSTPESSITMKEEPTSDDEEDMKQKNVPSTCADSSSLMGNVTSSDPTSQFYIQQHYTTSPTSFTAQRKECNGAFCEVLNQLADFNAKFLKLQQEKIAFEQEVRKQELEFQRQELECHKELTNILSKLAEKFNQP
ncbi:hypothetical protein GJAV_G00008090 [Gymnothorax javanicus]|nr:hypothetical protein GJAV_G00008090 [Gymnothorax javanicus]